MEFDFVTIISIVLAAVAAIASGFWLKAKGKFKQVANLFKEAYEVVAKIDEILADDKVDKQEVESLKKELRDVKDAFLTLVGKS